MASPCDPMKPLLTSSDLWMTHPEALQFLMPTECWGLCPPFSQTCWNLSVTAVTPPRALLREGHLTLWIGKRWGFCRANTSERGQRGLF